MDKNKIFGLSFSFDKKEKVVSEILNNSCDQRGRMRLVITPNVDHIVLLHNNEIYKKSCEYAWRLTIDGFPLQKFISYLIKIEAPRVTGADLFPDIMDGIIPEIHRPAFFVASNNSKVYIENYLLEKGYRHDGFYVCVPDFGFENDDLFKLKVLDQFKKMKCTHFFMGVGAPKSEIWAYENRDQLKDICVMCFGAGIEFFTHQLRRAPVWMQRNGFEWLWRLCSEPRRLAKRYIINSWMFFFYAIKEAFRQKLRSERLHGK